MFLCGTILQYTFSVAPVNYAIYRYIYTGVFSYVTII